MTFCYVQNCLKLIAPAAEETHTCRSGYDWLPEKSVCYRVTNAGTWELAMAPCVSDWPVEDYLPDYALLESVARSLQVEGKVSDLWLPVRRASIYGPLVFNASAIPGKERAKKSVYKKKTQSFYAQNLMGERQIQAGMANSPRWKNVCSSPKKVAVK